MTDIVAGQSTSLIDASLDSLRDGSHAINVHCSHAEIAVYTSCGDIPLR